MAELQGYLLQYKSIPQEAISNVLEWVNTCPKKEQKEKGFHAI
jgi:hypothetical protein